MFKFDMEIKERLQPNLQIYFLYKHYIFRQEISDLNILHNVWPDLSINIHIRSKLDSWLNLYEAFRRDSLFLPIIQADIANFNI